MSKFKKTLLAAAGMLAMGATHAAAISWSFDPSPVYTDPNGTVTARGTFVNTGDTTITAITWLWLDSFGSVGPHIQSYAWTPDFWALNSGLDIDPGESWSFDILEFTLANAPAGSYNAFAGRMEIGVVDTNGAFSGAVQSGNNLVVNVSEPGPLALLGLALTSLALLRRPV
jgi:hypothetical protein